MPTRFLSAAQIDRLGRFPDEVPRDDLIAYFTLSDDDLKFVRSHRRAPNRLGVALQLCALRYLGFVPAELKSAPSEAVVQLSQQLEVDPSSLDLYGTREQTRTHHHVEIRSYLGFHSAGPAELHTLDDWLVQRALEHDRPILLFTLGCEWLRTRRVVRPGIDRLMQMVATARQKAHIETHRRLEPLLTGPRRAQLDRLLVPDVTLGGQTRLSWLRRGAAAPNAAAIRGEIDKVVFLRQLGGEAPDLDCLTPNRRKFLAQLGRRSTNQALQRLSPERRHPILLALLHQSLIDLCDEVIYLFDQALASANSKARNALNKLRRVTARATNEKVVLFADLARLVLDPNVDDGDLRAAIYRHVSPPRLQAALEDAERIARPLDDSYFDLLGRYYGSIRKFAPAVLDAFAFRSSTGTSPLLDAVGQLKRIEQQGRRQLPDEAPLGFVPRRWAPYVTDKQGRLSRRYYELCVLYELRAGLRSGDVWLEGSRRYADPASYLIPAQQWPSRRAELCVLADIPEDGQQRLQMLAGQLDEALGRLETSLTDNKGVRIEDDRVVVSPLTADELPAETERLNGLVAERLPQVDLVDLLIEVDSWCGFSEHFTHAAGAAARSDESQRHLYAAIVAQACNLGLTTMAQAADGLSYRKLAWTTNWYLREETLRTALTALVDYQHQLPLAQVWGGGTLSSSDGQRFPVRGKAAGATALPRYFGLGKGLTFYTWTADQYAQYGTKVIPSTVRDATYVLDEILDNETELPIVEHTTDTSGYTELVFALFDLLGLRFSPRIRDLGAQRLYSLEPIATGASGAHGLLRRRINRQLILEQWDELLRVAGSLKLGWVTASLLISRLQASPRKNALTRALQEYGRITKTLFVLRWLESEDYRRRINRQLNKGESLHALRRFLFFANEGRVRRRTHEDQANQASCLNLVTNAVVVWNTVYMNEAVDQLRAEGLLDGDDDLSHLSPGLHEHINPYGRYRFDVDDGLTRKGLRPLRVPQPAP